MNQTKEQEQGIFSLWQEARKENALATGAAEEQTEENSNSLPDGDYTGRVFIQPETVADERSPNYGRTKFVIELMPTAEEYEDKTVYLNRVLSPYYLATPPPQSSPDFEKWRGALKSYMRQTDQILERCGVDISETDMTGFVQRIAQNNVSRPIVSFSIKNGVPTVHKVISREKSEALDAELEPLPDGNDIPI